MVVGFVLLNAAPNRERDVYQSLLAVPEVAEMHPLFGEFDLILRLETPTYPALRNVVTSRIRTIDGVARTHTLPGPAF